MLAAPRARSTLPLLNSGAFRARPRSYVPCRAVPFPSLTLNAPRRLHSGHYYNNYDYYDYYDNDGLRSAEK